MIVDMPWVAVLEVVAMEDIMQIMLGNMQNGELLILAVEEDAQLVCVTVAVVALVLLLLDGDIDRKML